MSNTQNKLVLFPEFNEAIIKVVKHLKIQYEVVDVAPSTFEELKEHASKTSVLKVWAGESTHTIYGSKEVNYAFRAWHDYTHLLLDAPFTLEGELTVALHQAKMVPKFAEVIMAEVYGQALHAIKTGEFPKDQVKFVLNYIKNGGSK